MIKSFAIISLFLLFSLVNINGNHADAQPFSYPLETVNVSGQRYCGYYVESGFAEGKYHTAQDMVGNGGTPVYAVADGIVSYSGPGTSGYGWLMGIDHPASGVYSLYGHLSTRRWKESAGTAVQIGELIGYLADDDEDGGSWGPHLHFAIRKGQRADYLQGGDLWWSLGYTYAHPLTLEWVDPLDFIEDHKEETKLAPPPPEGFRIVSVK